MALVCRLRAKLADARTRRGGSRRAARDPELTSSQCKPGIVSDQKRDEIDDVGVVEVVGSFLPAAICVPRVLLPHSVELRLLLVAQ